MEPVPFGKYLLVDKIAQGGMAEVYRALLRGPAGFEKTVALKRVLPAFSTIDDFITRFMDEAKLVAGLTHMNVAQVFDFGVVDGSYYLAMEFVEGVDLGRLEEAARRAGTPLPTAAAVFAVAEAARGLAYAHGRAERGRPLGIVHRDISPQNILISYAGEVKIADFGIAKATQAMHRMAHNTGSGAMMGKLRYMSPEQVAGEPLDGRSDVFALGVVLWEALTGQPLIDAHSPAEAVDQVKRAQFQPPSARSSGLPAELDQIVMKALQRDRDARYERAADLARDLGQWLAEKAPGFAREDLGAFVEKVAPRRREEPEEAEGRPELQPTQVDRRASSRPPRTAEATAHVDPRGQAPTRMVETPPRGWRRRTLVFGIVTALVGAGATAAVIKWRGRGLTPPTNDPVAIVDGGIALLALAPTDGGPDASRDRSAARSERQRALLAALAATPREDVTRRGVVSSPEYRALMSAVDGALCATPAGRDNPVFPDDAAQQLRDLALEPEARALARYLLAEDALPDGVQAALDAMLWKNHAFSPGGQGWSVAALAALAHPDNARFAQDLVLEQGTLGRWRDLPAAGAAAVRHPELCERRAAVDHLARLAPELPLTRALERYLAALPAGTPADLDGLRYSVVAAERDAEAQTLTVELQVTNSAAVAAPVSLGGARLAGIDRPPAVDPDLPTIAPNSYRAVRLAFAGFRDELAEAAVLALRPGVELQAYSEVLR